MLSAKAVYDFDTQRLPTLLKPFVEKNKNIKAFKIIEKIANEEIVKFYRDEDEVIFNKKIPPEYKKYEKFESNVMYNNENIAKVIIFVESKNRVKLTKQEIEWIKTHTVKVGVEQWAPAVFSNNGNDIDGITGDILKIIIARTGLKIKVINDGWINLLPAFKAKKIDLLPATYYTKERTAYGLYSRGYFKIKNCIYTKENNHNINSFKDLNGKKIAMEKGNANIGKIAKKFPKIRIIEVEDFGEAINMVLIGKVSATYDAQTAIESRIEDELIKGLKGLPQKSFKAPEVRFFSKIDEPLLQSILQKGLNSISHLEKHKIIIKWISSEKSIDFTNEELKYREKHKAIKYVYDPDWKPLEWTNELREHTGIISDFVKLVSQISGVNFREINSKTWGKAVKKVEDKKVNMYSGVGETKERKEYMNFTKNSFLTVPYVFVSRQGEDYIDGFEATKGKKIATIANYTIGKIMSQKRPDIAIASLKSIEEGFEKLKDKEIDILIINAFSAKYFINVLGYKKLKIAYKTKYNLELKIALSKNMPKEALTILDKSIKSISEKQKSDIVHKWTNVKVKKVTDWELIGKLLAFIALVVLFLLWNNRRLKLMVKEQTADILSKNKELEMLSASLEEKVRERTADLEKSQKNIRDSINYASHIQNAILPQEEILKKYFTDSFFLWRPRDIIGGDIYFISELKSRVEILIMVIDGAGHGVPGAFLTMLVKAIETKIISDINSGKLTPSPAIILQEFNNQIKTVVKQKKGSRSNIGFDGGVLYYNKETNICKYAGAKTPLYIINEDEIKILKSDRKNVGFIRTKIDQTYKEYDIEIKNGTKIYIATDGMIDQDNKNGLRYGKAKLQEVIFDNYDRVFNEQKDRILRDFRDFRGDISQLDDITVMGIKF